MHRMAGQPHVPQQVLFIQGAGTGAHDADEALVRSLRRLLGADYTTLYHQMPEEDETHELWQARIAEELAALEDQPILVGHSVGGSMLLKHLAEASGETTITGVFLIAVPYWGNGGWQAPTFRVDEARAAARLKDTPVYFYHSRDDEVVQFAHLALHARVFPQATLRILTDRGHQLRDDLSEVAADIARLPARR
jgi:predicted alpha/beta hydrolase family esterase